MSNELPVFKPIEEIKNIPSDFVGGFNSGLTYFQALAYLQGYVQITYNSMGELIENFNEFKEYINGHINPLVSEEVSNLLNQWLDDGTIINKLIAANVLLNTGGQMSGDLTFTQGKKVKALSSDGLMYDFLSQSFQNTNNYMEYGDARAYTNIISLSNPVWKKPDGSTTKMMTETDKNAIKEEINESVDQTVNNAVSAVNNSLESYKSTNNQRVSNVEQEANNNSTSIADIILKMTGVTLYESTSDTPISNVLLSQNISNFSKVGIVTRENQEYVFKVVRGSVSGKLHEMHMANSSTIQFVASDFTIENNSISQSNGKYFNITTTGTIAAGNQPCLITKVVAYK